MSSVDGGAAYETEAPIRLDRVAAVAARSGKETIPAEGAKACSATTRQLLAAPIAAFGRGDGFEH